MPALRKSEVHGWKEGLLIGLCVIVGYAKSQPSFFYTILCEHSEKHLWKIQSVCGGHIIFVNLTLKKEA